MATINLTIPVAGSTAFSTAAANVDSDLQTIQTWANGNIDAVNLSAVLAQAAAVNQSGQTVKGAVNIAASESRTNVAYGTLTTPDQVTGIVLPTNGLIAVWYQATWQESVANAAAAAIFLGANQVQIANTVSAGGQGAAVGDGAAPNVNRPLSSSPAGLQSLPVSTGAYSGDVTTGQIVGGNQNGIGGPCYIFAAAGTYTVSVQFKASSGSVTASNRKLWVQALSFA